MPSHLETIRRKQTQSIINNSSRSSLLNVDVNTSSNKTQEKNVSVRALTISPQSLHRKRDVTKIDWIGVDKSNYATDMKSHNKRTDNNNGDHITATSVSKLIYRITMKIRHQSPALSTQVNETQRENYNVTNGSTIIERSVNKVIIRNKLFDRQRTLSDDTTAINTVPFAGIEPGSSTNTSDSGQQFDYDTHGRVNKSQTIIARCHVIGLNLTRRWECTPKILHSNVHITNSTDDGRERSSNVNTTHILMETVTFVLGMKDLSKKVHQMRTHEHGNKDKSANSSNAYLLGNINVPLYNINGNTWTKKNANGVTSDGIVNGGLENHLHQRFKRQPSIRSKRFLLERRNNSTKDVNGSINDIELSAENENSMTILAHSEDLQRRNDSNHNNVTEHKKHSKMDSIKSMQPYTIVKLIQSNTHEIRENQETLSKTNSAGTALSKHSDNDLSREDDRFLHQNSSDISDDWSNNISAHISVEKTTNQPPTHNRTIIQPLGEKQLKIEHHNQSVLRNDYDGVEIDTANGMDFNVSVIQEQDVTSLTETNRGNVSRQMLRSSMLVNDMAVIQG